MLGFHSSKKTTMKRIGGFLLFCSSKTVLLILLRKLEIHQFPWQFTDMVSRKATAGILVSDLSETKARALFWLWSKKSFHAVHLILMKKKKKVAWKIFLSYLRLGFANLFFTTIVECTSMAEIVQSPESLAEGSCESEVKTKCYKYSKY